MGVFSFQDDMAKDKDMHSTVTTRIGQNFASRKSKHTTGDSPGVALIAVSRRRHPGVGTLLRQKKNKKYFANRIIDD